MGLTIREKINIAVSFIPGLSTVSGLISACIYYKQAKKGSMGSENLQMEQTAAKANDRAKKQLNNINEVSTQYQIKLWKTSLVGMIPGVNIFAAIYFAVNLNGLSEARNANYNDESLKKYLSKKYDITFDLNEKQNENFIEAITLIDNFNINDHVRIRFDNPFFKIKKGFFSLDKKKLLINECKIKLLCNPSPTPEEAVKSALDSMIEKHKKSLESIKQIINAPDETKKKEDQSKLKKLQSQRDRYINFLEELKTCADSVKSNSTSENDIKNSEKLDPVSSKVNSSLGPDEIDLKLKQERVFEEAKMLINQLNINDQMHTEKETDVEILKTIYSTEIKEKLIDYCKNQFNSDFIPTPEQAVISALSHVIEYYKNVNQRINQAIKNYPSDKLSADQISGIKNLQIDVELNKKLLEELKECIKQISINPNNKQYTNETYNLTLEKASS
jgi:hypothetical protein